MIFQPNFLNLEYFFNQVLNILNALSSFVFDYVGAPVLPYLRTIFVILCLLFIAGIIYSLMGVFEIRKEEDKKMGFAVPVRDGSAKRERWEVVINHLNSGNPAEWKLAIMEADNILDEMVEKMGYAGENLGERLRAVEQSDFNTIQSAWEAHKVRNKIAHEGSEFQLSEREARRIVGLYEKVFKEFEYI